DVRRRIPHVVTAGLLASGCLSLSAEDSTYLYTVQISAVVQSAPPSITLNWHPDQYAANSFTVYRKSKGANGWGAGTVLPGSATTYTDTEVAEGATYEYQIVKQATLGYIGYGYIYAGI